MLLMLTLNDDDNKPVVNKSYSDFLGLGKWGESLGNSVGKLLEKIPSQKLSPGQAFFLIIYLLSWIFYFAIAKLNSSRLPSSFFSFIPITLFITGLVMGCMFLVIEAVKKIKEK